MRNVVWSRTAPNIDQIENAISALRKKQGEINFFKLAWKIDFALFYYARSASYGIFIYKDIKSRPASYKWSMHNKRKTAETFEKICICQRRAEKNGVRKSCHQSAQTCWTEAEFLLPLEKSHEYFFTCIGGKNLFEHPLAPAGGPRKAVYPQRDGLLVPVIICAA